MARVKRGPELLKKWRDGLNLNQEKAAFILGIDHGALCAFETGYRKPGSKRAGRIEEATSGAVPASCWRPAKKRAA